MLSRRAVARAVGVALVPAVLAWARGASFEKAWRLSPSTFEGTLVRALRSLEELLKQLAEAAAALGDAPLRSRLLGECATALHRGVPFSASLYQ